jgi:hypothetical protein
VWILERSTRGSLGSEWPTPTVAETAEDAAEQCATCLGDAILAWHQPAKEAGNSVLC